MRDHDSKSIPRVIPGESSTRRRRPTPLSQHDPRTPAGGLPPAESRRGGPGTNAGVRSDDPDAAAVIRYIGMHALTSDHRPPKWFEAQMTTHEHVRDHRLQRLGGQQRCSRTPGLAWTETTWPRREPARSRFQARPWRSAPAFGGRTRCGSRRRIRPALVASTTQSRRNSPPSHRRNLEWVEVDSRGPMRVVCPRGGGL